MQIERPAAASIAVLIAAALICTAACAHQPQQRPDNTGVAAAPSSSSKNSCREDKDCGEGFCDRNACQTPSQTPSNPYGGTCVAAPRTPEGFRDAKQEFCGPYLCLDGRCRSCQSDTQCQSELGSPRCYRLPGEPGSRCGNPSP